MGIPSVRRQRQQQLLGLLAMVGAGGLQQRDRSRPRPPVAAENGLSQFLDRVVVWGCHLVPSMPTASGISHGAYLPRPDHTLAQYPVPTNVRASSADVVGRPGW